MSEEVTQTKGVSQLRAGGRLVGVTLEADGKSLMTRAVEAVTQLSKDTAGTMYPVSTPRFKDTNTALYTIGDCLCSLATNSKFEHLSITVGFTAIISGSRKALRVHGERLGMPPRPISRRGLERGYR